MKYCKLIHEHCYHKYNTVTRYTIKHLYKYKEKKSGEKR